MLTPHVPPHPAVTTTPDPLRQYEMHCQREAQQHEAAAKARRERLERELRREGAALIAPGQLPREGARRESGALVCGGELRREGAALVAKRREALLQIDGALNCHPHSLRVWQNHAVHFFPRSNFSTGITN